MNKRKSEELTAFRLECYVCIPCLFIKYQELLKLFKSMKEKYGEINPFEQVVVRIVSSAQRKKNSCVFTLVSDF